MRRFNLLVIAIVVFATTTGVSCSPGPETHAYRQRMREFVQNISNYAKERSPGFVVIPQNGLELLAQDPAEDAEEDAGEALLPKTAYLSAIDGVGREDLLYGYDEDDVPTPTGVTSAFLEYLDLAKANGVVPLAIDYCSTHANVDDSYAANNECGYISFAANHRELDVIPDYPGAPFHENADTISTLDQARNFLYLINPGAFESKQEYIDALASSRHDLIVMDFFYDNDELSPAEVAQIKQKPQGGSRLVIAYLSIGEAEDYRYYWQSGWRPGAPAWIETENPDWEGNYVVRYWDPAWQAIIYGSANAYLDKILAAGFNGVYLDIIDAFEYFEE